MSEDAGQGTGGVVVYGGAVRVESQAEARETIGEHSSMIAIVERGRPRAVIFSCPCGCGDVLSINVDREAGRAWKLLAGGGRVSLLPSIWRTSGCRSHFVLWESGVWWCTDASDDEWLEMADIDAVRRWLGYRFNPGGGRG